MSKTKPKKRNPQKNTPPDEVKAVQKSEANRLAFYLQRAILILGCFVLFLPLVVDYEYYYPYIFFKSILFRVAVQAMVFIYIILALISPLHRPRFHRLTYALMAYFGVMLVCSLPGISIGAWNSWWGDFTRMSGMFTQLHLLAYFLVLTQTLKQGRDWLVLFTTTLFSSLYMGATGLIHYAGLDYIFIFHHQDPRIGGATGNAGFFAPYMLLNLFVAVYLSARKDKSEIYPFMAKTWLVLLIAMDVFLVIWDIASGGRILSAGLALLPLGIFAFLLHGVSLLWFVMRRNAPAGTVFLSALGLYYLFWMVQSQTRATAVGLAGSLAFMSIFYVWKGAGKRLRWAAALLILLFAILPFTLFANRQSGWVRNNPLLSRLVSTSFGEHRLMTWKAGFLGILDRPVLGWGLEHYRNAFDLHAPAGIFTGPNAENWSDRAHNMIIDVGTTTGFLGLAAYIGFYSLVFAFLLRRWFKTREAADSLIIAGLLAAYLLQSLFTFDTVNTDGIVFLILAYVAYLYGKTKSDPVEVHDLQQAPVSISWRGWSVLAVTAAILACGFLYLIKEPHAANLLLNRGKALEKRRGSQSDTSRYVFREALMDAYQRAENYGTTGRYQVREEFANYACALAEANHIPIEQRARVAKKAADFLEKSILEDPSGAIHYMYMATLINSTFAILKQTDPGLAVSLAEKSLVWLQKAESLGPNRPQLYMERAQLLRSLGRNDDVIPVLQKVVAFNPPAKWSRVHLVAAYISAGRYRDAEIEWNKIKTYNQIPSQSDYDRVIGLYASKKQFAPVVALYKEQLQTSPDNPVLLLNLANAYKELGDLDSARQTLRRAATLSPQIAEKLPDLLKSLEEKVATLK